MYHPFDRIIVPDDGPGGRPSGEDQRSPAPAQESARVDSGSNRRSFLSTLFASGAAATAFLIGGPAFAQRDGRGRSDGDRGGDRGADGKIGSTRGRRGGRGDSDAPRTSHRRGRGRRGHRGRHGRGRWDRRGRWGRGRDRWDWDDWWDRRWDWGRGRRWRGRWRRRRHRDWRDRRGRYTTYALGEEG